MKKFLNKKGMVILALLLVVVFVSCQKENERLDKLMSHASAIMDVNIDSANVAYKILVGNKSQLENCSEKQKMRYELLCHEAMNKAYIPFSSDSTMLGVVDYYNHHGSANDRMLSHYILGCVYRDMHEAPLALEYCVKAVECADTVANDCDYALLSRIYGQMGDLYSAQGLPYQELSAYDQAEKYSYLAKDTLSAIAFYQGKSGAYDYLAQIDSAILINLNAAKMLEKYGDNYYAAISKGCNFKYYLAKNDTMKARKAFEAFLSVDYQGNPAFEDSKAYMLYEKGLYYMFQARMDSAYLCLQKALNESKSYGDKTDIAKALADYYAKLGDHKKVARYALLSLEYNDSDVIDTRKNQLDKLQALYDYSRHSEMERIAKDKAVYRMYIIFVLAASGILILILAFLIYRKNMKIKNQKLANMKALYDNCMRKLQDAKEDLVTLQNVTNDKMSALIMEKENVIKELQTEIMRYDEKNFGYKIADLDRELRNSAIFKRMEYIENHPQVEITKEEWELLGDTIEQIYPSFAILKRKISRKDYKITMLIKLNYSPSAISFRIGTTVSDISVSRKRLCLKVCGKTGTPKDWDDYVRSLV